MSGSGVHSDVQVLHRMLDAKKVYCSARASWLAATDLRSASEGILHPFGALHPVVNAKICVASISVA